MDEAISLRVSNLWAQTVADHDAFASIPRKAPPGADMFEARWNSWAVGYGGTQTTDGNAVQGSATTTSRIYGGAAGADYRLSPDTVLGFALGGGGTNYSLANGLGRGSSDLFQAGLYGRHNIGAFYLAGALAYGWQDITIDRTVTANGVDRLRARFEANAFSSRIESGYRVGSALAGLTPYAAGQFTAVSLPSYAEQTVSGANTFALNYGAKDATATRSELGLRGDTSYALADAMLILRGRAAWAHNFDSGRTIGATFQTLPGASFVVGGAAPAREAALVSASAETRWVNGFSLAAAFEGEFSDVTRSYAGKGIFKYAW